MRPCQILVTSKFHPNLTVTLYSTIMYIMPKPTIAVPLEFNWDLHNINKSWNKHHVDYRECEEIFKNIPHLVFEDIKHSQIEKRYTMIGQTNQGRQLHISFTLRNNQIRIISARDMHNKERRRYAEKVQETHY